MAGLAARPDPGGPSRPQGARPEHRTPAAAAAAPPGRRPRNRSPSEPTCPPARREAWPGGIYACLFPLPGRRRGRGDGGALPGPPPPLPRPERPPGAGALAAASRGRSRNSRSGAARSEPRKAARPPPPSPAQASVPKFENIPWLCEASLRNKPLILSLPKRYPHTSATSLNSWRKDVDAPNTFQVPNGLSKARRNHRGRQLCSTCQEVRMVQPRIMTIPDDLKHSFENCLSRRMKSLQLPKAHSGPRCSPDDISTESVHYRLPLLGPRTGAFHTLLLSDSYEALRGIQLSSSPRKEEPMGKTLRQ